MHRRIFLWSVAACLFTACRGEGPADEFAEAPESPLRLGSVVEAFPAPGESRRHPVVLEPGRFLGVRVEQRGLDVAVEVHDPYGALVLDVDAPIDSQGPEFVCFIAEKTGRHHLRVRPLEPQGGHYTLSVEELRPAVASDHDCQEATRIFTAVYERHGRKDGDPREWIERYERAATLWQESGHPFQAAGARRQAGLVWAELGDPARQERGLRQALELVRTVGEVHEEIKLHLQLGLFLHQAGRLSEARASFETALEIAQREGDPVGEATALNNLGLVARTAGEVHEALRFYERALAIYRAAGELQLAVTTLHNLGVGYTVLGRFDDAVDKLDEALELADPGDLRRRAHLLSAVGWALFQRATRDDSAELFEAAIGKYREALRLSHMVGDLPSKAEALDRLGTAYRSAGRYAEAFTAYQGVLYLAEVSGPRRHIAHARANLGWLLELWDRPRQAREELERAHELFRRLDDPDGTAFVLAGLARVERRSGDLSRARQLIEEALDVVRSLRLSARRLGARDSPHVLDRQYVELYVDLLMEQGDLEAAALAFEVSDLARARNLYEMLIESDIDLRRTLPAELRQRELDVQGRLNAAETERHELVTGGQAGDDELSELERLLREIVWDYEQVQNEIRRAHPRFAEISDPPVPELAEIQALLDPKTRILSFALGEERSFLFVVGPESLRSHPLPGRREIERLAQRVYLALRDSRHRRTRRQVLLNTSALSEMLLEPAWSELDVERLVIVPEGVLHYIPFAALPQPGAAEDSRLVVDDYEVVQAPSASVLAALRRREEDRQPPAGRLAVLADPVFSPDDPRVLSRPDPEPPLSAERDATSPVVELELTRLPNTRSEAESIAARIAPGDRLVLLDFDASKQAVLDGRLSDYRILHFATHALIHEEHPELSGIELCRVDRGGRPTDGYLRLHEIFALDLPADLVVLSACRTALGERVRGGGLIGLTRGFFYAGASRLVVSLWDVPDAATSELMKEFYEGMLADGLGPAAALRRAQQRIRRQPRWTEPYYWAGFVLQGDWHELPP